MYLNIIYVEIVFRKLPIRKEKNLSTVKTNILIPKNEEKYVLNLNQNELKNRNRCLQNLIN
jgi:hypothetical protein